MPTLPRFISWRNTQWLVIVSVTVLCYSALYPPVELSFLAWVALVPWLTCVLVCPARMHLSISYLAGLGFFLLNLTWILGITVPGYLSMSIYLAFYWCLAAWGIDRLVRVHRWPAFVAVPIVWVGCEHLRGWLITGFPWFFLGHSQVMCLPVIQIADLAGAYGVSFIVAMTNGLLADVVVQVYHRRWCLRGTVTAAAITCVVLAGTIAYGVLRIGQDTVRDGPRLAVVQDDFPLNVDVEPKDFETILMSHLATSVKAGAERPAMIVWPETSVTLSINPEFTAADQDVGDFAVDQSFGKEVFDILADHARDAQSHLIVGSISKHINPPGHYPTVDKYNSAMIFNPQGNLAGRYDKIHLVLFGEFVPFRYTCPAVYRLLNEHMTPYGRGGREYSLTAGNELKRFRLDVDGCGYRYAVAICYEDTMAYLVRRFAYGEGEKQIDFLVNISNDGWFNHSCELPQHLRICAFRAVENRIGIARAVNTGISAFIDPLGRIEQTVQSAGRSYGPGVRGHLTRNVKLDSRVTVYSRYGDWFAIVCFVILAVTATGATSFVNRLFRPAQSGKDGP